MWWMNQKQKGRGGNGGWKLWIIWAVFGCNLFLFQRKLFVNCLLLTFTRLVRSSLHRSLLSVWLKHRFSSSKVLGFQGKSLRCNSLFSNTVPHLLLCITVNHKKSKHIKNTSFQKWKFSHGLLTVEPEVSKSTKHFWSLKANRVTAFSWTTEVDWHSC